MEQLDVVVIGAGVVGLAVARALARQGREVTVLEASDRFGSGVSSRNSEVIHAGLYYPPGSLKARLCVAGRRALYAYCVERGIAHRRVGKLIVATQTAEIAALETIAARAAAAGAPLPPPLSAAQALALEPELRCVGALFSPDTGVIDSHGYMLALLGDLEAAGGQLILRAPVIGGTATPEGMLLEIGGTEPLALRARTVINAAGLFAPGLSRRLRGLDDASIPPAYFCKGVYFSLSGRSPFRHLVYPAPEQAGLGIHLTLDLAGRARFGPDVDWVEPPGGDPAALDYRVDPARAARFATAIQRYWPGLDPARLAPDYAGVRPKITPPGAPAADFIILGPNAHGAPGYVALYGVESPGLTASLALGDHVAALL